jgi:CubicO group peptidase (beta-lactamase class C family)
VVEKITGQTYFNYIRQHIFAQAGMAQTDFLDLDDVVPNVAEGYIPVKDHQRIVTGWKKNYYVTTAGPAADGGVTSTVEDLARYVRAIRQGQVISPEKVALMCSPQVVVEEDNITGLKWHYGFGCYVQLDRSGNLIRWGHAGEEEGISRRLWHYPQHDLDVVILGNQSACAGKVSVAIQKLVLDF